MASASSRFTGHDWRWVCSALSSPLFPPAKLPVVDTVIIERGRPTTWLSLQADGTLQPRAVSNSNSTEIYNAFCNFSLGYSGNKAARACVAHYAVGLPQVIDKPTFATHITVGFLVATCIQPYSAPQGCARLATNLRYEYLASDDPALRDPSLPRVPVFQYIDNAAAGPGEPSFRMVPSSLASPPIPADLIERMRAITQQLIHYLHRAVPRERVVKLISEFSLDENGHLWLVYCPDVRTEYNPLLALPDREKDGVSSALAAVGAANDAKEMVTLPDGTQVPVHKVGIAEVPPVGIRDLSELRSSPSPSTGMQQIAALLGQCVTGQARDWKRAINLLRGSGADEFLLQMRTIERTPHMLTLERLEAMRPIIESEPMQHANLKRVGLLGERLALWVLGITQAALEYYGCPSYVDLPLLLNTAGSASLAANVRSQLHHAGASVHGVAVRERSNSADVDPVAAATARAREIARQTAATMAGAKAAALAANPLGQSLTHRAHKKPGHGAGEGSGAGGGAGATATGRPRAASSGADGSAAAPAAGPGASGAAATASATGGGGGRPAMTAADGYVGPSVTGKTVKPVAAASVGMTGPGALLPGATEAGIFRCADGVTTMPFAVIGSRDSAATLHRTSLVIINDLFDTMEGVMRSVVPLLDAGVHALLFNLPGQAHTSYIPYDAATTPLSSMEPTRVPDMVEVKEEQPDIPLGEARAGTLQPPKLALTSIVASSVAAATHQAESVLGIAGPPSADHDGSFLSPDFPGAKVMPDGSVVYMDPATDPAVQVAEYLSNGGPDAGGPVVEEARPLPPANPALLNPDFLASCVHQLLTYLDGMRMFPTAGAQWTFDVVGLGSGGAVAMTWASRYSQQYVKRGKEDVYIPRDKSGREMARLARGLRSVVCVNGYAHLDPQLKTILDSTKTVFSTFSPTRSDLPVAFFSRFLFSDRFLSVVPREEAIAQYTSTPNPISLNGRMALVHGALCTGDVRAALSAVPVPLVLISAADDSLVAASNSRVLATARKHFVEVDADHSMPSIAVEKPYMGLAQSQGPAWGAWGGGLNGGSGASTPHLGSSDAYPPSLLFFDTPLPTEAVLHLAHTLNSQENTLVLRLKCGHEMRQERPTTFTHILMTLMNTAAEMEAARVAYMQAHGIPTGPPDGGGGEGGGSAGGRRDHGGTGGGHGGGGGSRSGRPPGTSGTGRSSSRGPASTRASSRGPTGGRQRSSGAVASGDGAGSGEGSGGGRDAEEGEQQHTDNEEEEADGDDATVAERATTAGDNAAEEEDKEAGREPAYDAAHDTNIDEAILAASVVQPGRPPRRRPDPHLLPPEMLPLEGTILYDLNPPPPDLKAEALLEERAARDAAEAAIVRDTEAKLIAAQAERRAEWEAGDKAVVKGMHEFAAADRSKRDVELAAAARIVERNQVVTMIKNAKVWEEVAAAADAVTIPTLPLGPLREDNMEFASKMLRDSEAPGGLNTVDTPHEITQEEYEAIKDIPFAMMREAAARAAEEEHARREEALRQLDIHRNDCATRIQALMRGHLARIRIREMRIAKLLQRAEVKAAIKIQRLVRGRSHTLGDMRLRRERRLAWRYHNAAVDMQRVGRGFIARRTAYAMRLDRSALTIQRVYRGFVARVFCRMRAAERDALRKVERSVTKVQSAWRMYSTRRDFKELLVIQLAALQVQRWYRGWKARREYRRLKQLAVLKPSAEKVELGFQHMRSLTGVFARSRDLVDKLTRSLYRAENELATTKIAIRERNHKLKIVVDKLEELRKSEAEVKAVLGKQGALEEALKSASSSMAQPTHANGQKKGGAGAGAGAAGKGKGAAAAAPKPPLPGVGKIDGGALARAAVGLNCGFPGGLSSIISGQDKAFGRVPADIAREMKEQELEVAFEVELALRQSFARHGKQHAELESERHKLEEELKALTERMDTLQQSVKDITAATKRNTKGYSKVKDEIEALANEQRNQVELARPPPPPPMPTPAMVQDLHRRIRAIQNVSDHHSTVLGSTRWELNRVMRSVLPDYIGGVSMVAAAKKLNVAALTNAVGSEEAARQQLGELAPGGLLGGGVKNTNTRVDFHHKAQQQLVFQSTAERYGIPLVSPEKLLLEDGGYEEDTTPTKVPASGDSVDRATPRSSPERGPSSASNIWRRDRDRGRVSTPSSGSRRSAREAMLEASPEARATHGVGLIQLTASQKKGKGLRQLMELTGTRNPRGPLGKGLDPDVEPLGLALPGAGEPARKSSKTTTTLLPVAEAMSLVMVMPGQGRPGSGGRHEKEGDGEEGGSPRRRGRRGSANSVMSDATHMSDISDVDSPPRRPTSFELTRLQAQQEAREAVRHTFPRKIRDWTATDVAFWLKALQMGRYAEAFEEAGVDGNFLMAVKPRDFRDVLGVEERDHLIVILNAREELRAADIRHDASKAVRSDTLHRLESVGIAGLNGRASQLIAELNDHRVPDASVVFAYARAGRTRRVEDALKAGFDLHTRDDDGNTLLLICARHGHKMLVELLLSRGANPNDVNLAGNSSLHYLMDPVLQSRVDPDGSLARLLVDQGGNDRLRNKFGYWPVNGLGPDGHPEVIATRAGNHKTVSSFSLPPVPTADTLGATGTLGLPPRAPVPVRAH